MAMREDVRTKGRRLLVEGRLRVHAITGHEVIATCMGDSAELYRLGLSRTSDFCTCPARGRCSHLTALLLVALRPLDEREHA
jgi:uncharacterized Zn finger protein